MNEPMAPILVRSISSNVEYRYEYEAPILEKSCTFETLVLRTAAYGSLSLPAIEVSLSKKKPQIRLYHLDIWSQDFKDLALLEY
jgi:hypothetical protein